MLIPQSYSNGPVQRSVCHDCYESNYSSTRSSERARYVDATAVLHPPRTESSHLSCTIEPLMAPRRSARKASEGKAAVDLTLSSSPSPSSDVEVQDAPHRRSSPRKKTKTMETTTTEDADEAFARALQDEEDAAAAMDQDAPAAGTSKVNQDRVEEAAAMNSNSSRNALADAFTSTSEADPVDKDDPQAIVGAFESLFVDGTGCQKCSVAARSSTENDEKKASKQSAVSGFVARLSSLWTIAALFNSVGNPRTATGHWTKSSSNFAGSCPNSEGIDARFFLLS